MATGPSAPPDPTSRDLAADFRSGVDHLLELLDGEQRAAVLLPFDGEVRRTWAYWPTARPGLALHELDRAASKAVLRLLSSALSAPAFARAVTVMGLDEVLDRAEGHGGDRRHRDDYWVAVFGDPRSSTWGWRFEGHHVSVHATIAGDGVALSPLFLGANPAVVADDGGRVVTAPLAVEEALGFELLHALTVEQRADATVADTAPDDIRTRNDPRIDASLATSGLPIDSITGAGAASAARALVECYLARFPAGAARPDPTGARFAWSGADEPGIGHHYHVAAPRLLVELDNTQDGANHVHTVVRDPAGDFGDDLLATHHREHHGPPARDEGRAGGP